MDKFEKAVFRGALEGMVGEIIEHLMTGLQKTEERELVLELLIEKGTAEMRRRRGPQETAGFLMVVADRIPVMEG